MQYHPYAIYLFLSAVITLLASITALRRSAPGSFTMGMLLLSMTIWAGSDGTQLLQATQAGRFFWWHAMFIGVVSVPVLFLVFTLQFTNNEAWLSPRNLFLVSVLPIITLLIEWTNGEHHFYYSSIRTVETDGAILIGLTRGPWYFVGTLYSFLMIALGLFTLIMNSLRSGQLFRNQSRLILLGCIIPFFFSVYSQYRFASVYPFDAIPITFGISGMIFTIAIHRTGFMNLIPVARSRLIENMQDGVLVLDSQNRIVDYNLSMENFLGDTPSSLLGENAFEILAKWMDNADPLLGGLESQTEMKISTNPPIYLDLRVSPLYDKNNILNGRLIVFRDVTDRKDVERKLRNTNYRMQSQLIKIGTLQSQLREQAVRDSLTNLFNRRYLEETLDRELARAAREQYPVCVIMVDIDHFKQVNDTYGHEAGDLILKALAETLSRQSRRGDFACRFGGEEFVVVMPNINTQLAYQRAQTLRESIHSLHVPYGRNDLTATISMGISCYPSNGETREALLRAADQAMYAAKDAGRDHIRLYEQIEAVKD